MKIGKTLVIAMAAILTMMVGYALFSESININGTASAKGEFDYSVDCTPGLMSEVPESYNQIIDFIGSYYDPEAENEGGYANDTCVVNNKMVNISTELQYPTANRLFTIKITNTGSIAMKLNEEGTDSTEDNFVGDSSVDYNTIKNGVIAYYVDGKSALQELSTVIEPGKTAMLVIIAFWRDDDIAHNGISQKDIFTYTLPFIQAN